MLAASANAASNSLSGIFSRLPFTSAKTSLTLFAANFLVQSPMYGIPMPLLDFFASFIFSARASISGTSTENPFSRVSIETRYVSLYTLDQPIAMKYICEDDGTNAAGILTPVNTSFTLFSRSLFVPVSYTVQVSTVTLS